MGPLLFGETHFLYFWLCRFAFHIVCMLYPPHAKSTAAVATLCNATGVVNMAYSVSEELLQCCNTFWLWWNSVWSLLHRLLFCSLLRDFFVNSWVNLNTRTSSWNETTEIRNWLWVSSFGVYEMTSSSFVLIDSLSKKWNYWDNCKVSKPIDVFTNKRLID